jgi:hypothetical protein
VDSINSRVTLLLLNIRAAAARSPKLSSELPANASLSELELEGELEGKLLKSISAGQDRLLGPVCSVFSSRQKNVFLMIRGTALTVSMSSLLP